MASPALKRSLEDVPIYTNAVDVHNDQADTLAAIRASSPLSSVSSNLPPDLSTAGDPTTTAAPPAKKRKLTPAEKEAARAEKEKVQQERAAQKAQKEEEKRLKFEEKKAKDEEKEEKRRVKEAEKAAKEQERAAKEQEKKEKQDKKDAERKAKDDEKAKKERSQMRLTGFFGKPKGGSPAGSPASSRRGSIASVDETETPQATPAKPLKNALFLPFEPPTHSTIAPYNRFDRDGPAVSFAVDRIDQCMTSQQAQEWTTPVKKHILEEYFQPPVKRRRYVGPTSVKEIISSMQGSQDRPIDLTSNSKPVSVSPIEALKKVPVKQFKYQEDVRPPYIGTFTKVPKERSIKSLSRKPFEKALPKIDYDYDSEAEWEEPEEGEDLVSEGEEEGDDDVPDEMDGFLDDEDAENDPRRRHVVDVPPLQTDMHWETGRRNSTSDTVPMGDISLDLQKFRIETFLEETLVSIDPFSASYWQTIGALSVEDINLESSTNMAPPRLPLSSIPGATNMTISLGSSPLGPSHIPSSAGKTDSTKKSAGPGFSATNSGKSKAGRPAAQPLAPELLDSFKAAIVEYQTLTKLGLIEVLKKKFPSASKVTVADALESLAVRVGAKQADKHWELKP